MAGNHDHAQLDLLLGGEFVAMFLVVFFYFGRRNNQVLLDVLTAHRLHDHAFHLLFFKLAQRVVLRLQRLDKRVAIAAE